MTHPTTCPKCAGAMAGGFVLDQTYGGRGVASWVEGEPNRNFWVGVTLGDKKPIEIATWRCNSCGYLESYAS